MITSAALVEKFRYALKNNWGYIWGTSGEKWTETKQKNIEKTTDENRAQARKIGSKWIGHTVSDCSGLFTWAFRQLGGSMYHGSDTMYRKWCTDHGELKSGKRTDKATLKAGTAVFHWNGTKYSHVGLFVGDGLVIEAANTQKGVITSKVTASQWTHWGELKGCSYDGKEPAPEPKPEPKPEPQPAEKRPTLKRGSKGTHVVDLQTALVKLGYGVGPCGIDGDYGRSTQAAVQQFQLDHKLTTDGICGPKTLAAIDAALEKAASEPAPVITYAVVIPGLSLDEAKKIQEKYPKATIEGSVG